MGSLRRARMASEFASSRLSALWSKSCLSSSVMRQLTVHVYTPIVFSLRLVGATGDPP